MECNHRAAITSLPHGLEGGKFQWSTPVGFGNYPAAAGKHPGQTRAQLFRDPGGVTVRRVEKHEIETAGGNGGDLIRRFGPDQFGLVGQSQIVDIAHRRPGVPVDQHR